MRFVIISFRSVPCVLCSHVRLYWGCRMMIRICWDIAPRKGIVHKGATRGIQKCQPKQVRGQSAKSGRPERSLRKDRPRIDPSLMRRPVRSLRKDRPRMDPSLEERLGRSLPKDHVRNSRHQKSQPRRPLRTDCGESLRRIIAEDRLEKDVLSAAVQSIGLWRV